MKNIFIPVKSKEQINLKILKTLEKIPKNIVIAYSIQYENLAKKIKQSLKKHHIVSFIQVLGCSKPKLPKEAKAILLISSGKFHGISLAYETKLPVYILINNKLQKISEKDLGIIKTNQKVSYLKFLNAKKVGVLVSTKPGQNRLKKARDFKKKIKNKKAYLFLSNNINNQEFQNFNIDSWVNTSCPRLDMEDNRIINIDRL